VFITGNSGFPKALDVSKAIDKAADAEREVTGKKTLPDGSSHDYNVGYGEGVGYESKESERLETQPATDAAERWDGFKTALKPATEFVVVARKPFDGTVAENVQTHGTGALNIDGTRVGVSDADNLGQTATRDDSRSGELYAGGDDGSEHGDEVTTSVTSEGRYPSNVVFDETEAERLDREVGDLHESTESTRGSDVFNTLYEGGTDAGDTEGQNIAFGDSGGPSRYFYTSKASKAERTLDGTIDNAHPTVKPADLMEWLVTLVTAEGQTVLDPFAGSGTTCRAAKDLGREFIGVEKQRKWADVARVRAGLTPDDPSTVREDGVTGLDAFTDGGEP